jgi:arylsulfatase A-like enzyme
MNAAEIWLEKHYKEKFFLLIDTWDPHEPWESPTYYVEKYYDNFDGEPSPYPCYANWEKAGRTKHNLKLGHAHYCGEVTMVDRWIGRVIERIESLGLMEKTAIFFVSDHGFYFGEHGLFGKAVMRTEDGCYLVGPSHKGGLEKDKVTMLFQSKDPGEAKPGVSQWWRSPIYDEVARIPLIMYLPGKERKRINAMTTLPDLMPTIIELAQIEVPEYIQASSLMPLIREEKDSIHDCVITSWPLYNPGQTIRVVDDWTRRVVEPLPSSITDGEWCLLYAMEGEPIELYNRLSDRKQEKNIYQHNVDIAKKLHHSFVEFLKKHGTDEALLRPRLKL